MAANNRQPEIERFTIDNFISKVVTPAERVFGFILLGNATVRGLQGRGFGSSSGTGATGP